MVDKISLSLLKKGDFDQIVSSFKEIGWNKPINLYKSYLLEQENGKRSVLVAKEKETFCGYVTIKWKPAYHFFKEQNIPEISDLNVLPHYRQQGIGTRLIATCENMAKEQGYSQIGLGVGLTADYGNVQRLYVQLGYIPDGHGLYYKNIPVSHGNQVIADDDLIIYMCKSLNT